METCTTTYSKYSIFITPRGKTKAILREKVWWVPLPKKLLCKSYTKCIQKLYKTLNLHIFSICMINLYIFSICIFSILYDNECTKTVHQIQTYIQKMYKLYKTCTSSD